MISEALVFCPAVPEDRAAMEAVLQEIIEVLMTRSDGVSIKIGRSLHYPPHKGKALIEKVEIETWDCGVRGGAARKAQVRFPVEEVPWSEEYRQGHCEGAKLQYRVCVEALRQVREGRDPKDVEGPFGEELRKLLAAHESQVLSGAAKQASPEEECEEFGGA